MELTFASVHSLSRVLFMDSDDVNGTKEDFLDSSHPKRKSPFVTERADDEISPAVEPAMDEGLKYPRKNSFNMDLPNLLANECELLVEMESFMQEVDVAEPLEFASFARVERRSNPSTSGRLTFQLVTFLTKRYLKPDEPIYDLGLYVRAQPSASAGESVAWAYPNVSMMVMLLNSKDPFSPYSKVSRDCCTFSSSDPCRGWQAMTSFTSLEELRTKGFLFGTSTVVARCQASFDGCETVVDPSVPVPFTGLENQGATCYLNGLLQSLYHVGRFREIVYSPRAGEEDILSAMQTVFFDLETSQDFVSSEPLTRAFGWDSLDVGVQHDAQELNRILIDRIEGNLKLSGRDSEIKSLFCGTLENYIDCMDIDYRSTRTEDFYDIQLSLVSGFGADQKTMPSIEAAIEEYFSVEILEGPNSYDAGEGRGLQRAKKGVRFIDLPPILTFQLMRFHFDFELCELRKLNQRFSFSANLDLTKFVENSDNSTPAEYQLYSVLVHSGGVHSGHYYAYARPGGGTDWYKFDDTIVSRVEEFCAIENNFGGPGQRQCVNYLVGGSECSDPGEEGPDKVYSAYMLMYVRKNVAESLLPARRLEEVNPELFRELMQKRSEAGPTAKPAKRRNLNLRSRQQRHDSEDDDGDSMDAIDVPIAVKFLKCNEPVFGSIIRLHSEIPRDWFEEVVLPPTTESTESVPGETNSYFEGGTIMLDVIPSLDENMALFHLRCAEQSVRLVEVTPADLTTHTVGELRGESLFNDPLVLMRVPSETRLTPDDIAFVMLRFDNGSLEFTGIEFCQPGNIIRGITAHAVGRLGDAAVPIKLWAIKRAFELVPVSEESIEPGMLIVYHPDVSGVEDACEFFTRKAHTIYMDLVVHPVDSKWILNGMPAVEGSLIGKAAGTGVEPTVIRVAEIDSRNLVSSIGRFVPGFDPETHELTVFKSDPFASDVKAGDNLASGDRAVGDTLPGCSKYHCVVIPKAPSAAPGESRWRQPHPVCVRLFSDGVIETMSRVVYCYPDETIAELMGRVRGELQLPVSKRYRLIDIDPVECEILSVYSQDETVPVSALLSWSTRNIFSNSIRIEEVSEGPGENIVRCSHFDRGTRTAFGHPFLVVVPSLPDETPEVALRDAVMHKLEVPPSRIRGWRLVEEHGKVMIVHSQNPASAQTSPQDRPLFIKG